MQSLFNKLEMRHHDDTGLLVPKEFKDGDTIPAGFHWTASFLLMFEPGDPLGQFGLAWEFNGPFKFDWNARYPVRHVAPGDMKQYLGTNPMKTGTWYKFGTGYQQSPELAGDYLLTLRTFRHEDAYQEPSWPQVRFVSLGDREAVLAKLRRIGWI